MLLAIDTCGPTGTLALGRWNGETATVLAQTELPGKAFTAQLIPKMRELLMQHSATVNDLHAIVVINGPGSFTGVRIGVSTAKGLAEALQIPVIALSRLALLAQKGQTSAAAIDAGRGEFYFGSYADGEILEALMSRSQLQDQVSESFSICEESAARVWPDAHLVPAPDAADALSAATARLREKDYEDIVTLDGNYVRRTAAELFARPAVGRE